jgi:hypothetical protein
MIPETTHLETDGEIRFIALGDAGSGLPAQQRIADRLVEYHDRSPYRLVLLLGDNIYPNGDTIKYGEKRFTTLYKPLLQRGVIFKAVLGNHDISGPLGVGYPTFWMSNRDENMRFFNMPYTFYDFTYGPIHFFMLDTNKFKSMQRLWLSERLTQSDRPWKIVCGHHPVLSSGFHGCTPRLRRHLKPMLEKHGAALYLSAHEHDYERFKAVHGVHYIVSGGGGADLRKFRHPLPESLVRYSQHHFLAGVVNEHAASLEVINDRGIPIDQTELALESLCVK